MQLQEFIARKKMNPNDYCFECGRKFEDGEAVSGSSVDGYCCKGGCVHVPHPICPINCYFEGDEYKCDVSKCDWDYKTRSCNSMCVIKGDINMSEKIDAMPLKEFDKFLTEELNEIRSILASKSDDYSTDADKLANFKLQARMDGITPVEALRGNWLKHRASIVQGLNDLKINKIRPMKWWDEKLRDDRNYNILLHALIYVTYFKEDVL